MLGLWLLLPFFLHTADAVASGLAQGWLAKEEDVVKLAIAQPTRAQLLLAMQAHGIELQHYDLIQLRSLLFPAEAFYAAVYNVGGPQQVCAHAFVRGVGGRGNLGSGGVVVVVRVGGGGGGGQAGLHSNLLTMNCPCSCR